MAIFSSASDTSSDTGATICFADRHEAGERLAQAVLAELSRIPISPDQRYVVYALPRGGLPVAKPVARALGCPLDVIVAKKITRPDNPELAIGAVTADRQVLWAPHRRIGCPPAELYHEALERAQTHALAQWQEFSPQGFRVNPAGAIALLVDDGIATGMTIAVAARSLRAQQVAQVWICAPVAPPDLIPFLQQVGDRTIVLATPAPFNSVSRFYREFHQLTNDEAIGYLRQE